MSKTVSLTIPDEYYAEIIEYCAGKGHITIQALIKMSVRNYIDLYRKKKPHQTREDAR